MVERAYLDYYERNRLVPSRQDLSDIDRHMARREALYRHLGLLPAWLRGARILEIGPGTGDNAMYLDQFEPSLFTMVEGNEHAVAEIKARCADGRLRASAVEAHHADGATWRDDRLYDLVLCEGVLPGQAEPAAFLRHLSSFVAPGGVLVGTTTNASSNFAEVLRRMVKPVLASRGLSGDALSSALQRIFEPHLAALPGMSRAPSDWVADNIIYPWMVVPVFQAEDAIACVADRFDVLGTSPKFLTEWRWYKSVALDERGYNDVARTQIERANSAFLDFRVTPDSIGPHDAARLEDLCLDVCRRHDPIHRTDDLSELGGFVDAVHEVEAEIRDAMPLTSRSIRDFLSAFDALVGGELDPSFGEFTGYFGRGQMYISFIRRGGGSVGQTISP